VNGNVESARSNNFRIRLSEGIFYSNFYNIKISITTKLWDGIYPFNSRIHSLKQVHGERIIEVKKGSLFKKEGDGFFTSDKGVVLEVKTADCFPVFISDKNLIMLLHVGWRGAKKGIVEKGIKIFQERGNIKDARVFLGPGIKKCCYEIKEDVAKFFEEFIEKRDKKIYLDLEKFIIDKFLNAGLKKENIFSFPHCTSCRNDLFYSHRKGDRGRIRAWILKE